MRARLGATLGRVTVGALLCLAAGACGGAPSRSVEDQDAVPRPEWRVGDRWVFRRTTLSGDTVVVTHQVTAAPPGQYVLRITGLATEVTRRFTADLHLAGQTVAGRAAARFEPPAMYFAWPLTLGKTWTQEIEYRDGVADGRYGNRWQVAPRLERVETLVGPFYAVRIDRWGGATQRLESYWYSPRVRYWVKLEDYAGGYTEELVQFGTFGQTGWRDATQGRRG